ncbi:hypothetical protein D3C71_2020960 [compost metagenome]
MSVPTSTTIALCDSYFRWVAAKSKSKLLPERLLCSRSPTFGAYCATRRPRNTPCPACALAMAAWMKSPWRAEKPN